MTTRFFYPALYMMSRLGLRQKFMLISMLFMVPLVGFVWHLSDQMSIASDIASQEKEGNRYIAPLRSMLSNAIEERIAAHAHYVHDAPLEEMTDCQARIESDLASLEDVDRAIGPTPDVSNAIKALRASWTDLKARGAQADDGTLPNQGRIKFIGQITALIVSVGDASGLILDPQINSYYLMYNSVVVLPQTQALLGQLAYTGDNMIRFRHIASADRTNVPILAGQVRSNLEALERGVNIANDPSRADMRSPSLTRDLQAYKTATDAFLSLMESQAGISVGLPAVADPTAPRPSEDDPQVQGFRNSRLAVANTGETLWKNDISMLDDVLTARSDLAAQQRLQTIGIAALILLIVSYLTIGFYVVVFRSVSSLQRAARHIVGSDLEALASATAAVARGDLTARVSIQSEPLLIESRDELGGLAEVFNEMVAKLRETGASFEQMGADLRRLVGQVGSHVATINSASIHLAEAADQAEHATSQIAGATQQVAHGTEQQNDGVARTAKTIEDMSLAIDDLARGAQDQAAAVGSSFELSERITTAITQVAAHAQASSQAALESRLAAHSGADAVDQSIEGMNRIAAKVETSAQKVKDMGASSQEIGTIVDAIDDIADRTTLLALNAAIEAARAGEHGRGFAVVAEEVRALAERASASTKEINLLIRGIEETVVQAVSATDDAQREVQAGVGTANEVRQALKRSLDAAEAASQRADEISSGAQEISASSGELLDAMRVVSQIVDQNAAAAERMAAASAEVERSVEHIATISEDNSASAEEVSAAAEEVNAQAQGVAALAQSLSQMAQSLHEAVSQFRLEQRDVADFAEAETLTAPPTNGAAKSTLSDDNEILAIGGSDLSRN